MGNKAVLEIGTEEIPAKKAFEIHENLEKSACRILKDYRINVEKIRVVGAPRRLSLILDNLADKQETLIQEIKGPPYNIAYDDQGEPTRAATGFAENQNVEVDQLEVRDTENGRYMFAIIEKENKSAESLLPEVFPEIIKALEMPETMRWGDYQLEFIRPIHWLCALFNDRVINFNLGNLSSGRETRGHRYLAEGKIEVEHAEEYLKTLKDNYVIADPEARKNIILSGFDKIEEKSGGKVEKDDQLLNEVINLVEYPTPFCGEFPQKYLNLPDPVLVTPIKAHQRYFPLRNGSGELLSKFVGVRDGGKDNLETVIEGNEKVLKARFADAEFYYEKDLKETMEERMEKLAGIVFREELGTMLDKVKRIKKIVSWLAEKINLDSKLIPEIKKAAYLSKSDLVTHMVREFPELQGIMGEIYARKEGEDESICKAISEHYHPQYSKDRLPDNDLGKLISIADRIDNLAGCFAIDLIPTGSEDPYGLRRDAIGIIRLLEESEIEINLNDLSDFTLNLFAETVETGQNTVDKVVNYILERLANILEERGVNQDIIRAVINQFPAEIIAIIECSRVLSDIRGEKKFEKLVTAYNRVANIVENHKKNEIKSELLLEKEEKNLYNTYLEVGKKIKNLNQKHPYFLIYQLLTDLIFCVHEFFENVIVMTDRDIIKENRLNLLAGIYEQMSLLGDLSEIAVEKNQ